MSVAIKKTVLTCKAFTAKWQKLRAQFQTVMFYKHIEPYRMLQLKKTFIVP